MLIWNGRQTMWKTVGSRRKRVKFMRVYHFAIDDKAAKMLDLPMKRLKLGSKVCMKVVQTAMSSCIFCFWTSTILMCYY